MIKRGLAKTKTAPKAKAKAAPKKTALGRLDIPKRPERREHRDRLERLCEPRIQFLDAAAAPARERSNISVITVSPRRLFVHYEFREKALISGHPVLRVHDVKRGLRASSFDIPIKKKAGSLYIPVLPGRDFIAELGVIKANGKFVRAKLSKGASTPRTSPPKGKSLIPEKYFEFRFGGSSR